jgi:hypothetical protein
MGMEGSRIRRIAVAGLTIGMLVAPCALAGRDQPTVEELKARLGNTNIADRPPLCIHISERQLDAGERFYIAGDSEKAQAALTIRKMARKLGDLKHTVSREDQEQIQKAIDRLERIRDDLLAAMFPKGGKK